MATDQSAHDPLPASSSKDSLVAKCHCGRVRLQLPSKPTSLNECHCTVCYQYGALWAYYERKDVVVTTASDTTLQAYIRDDSDGDLSFNRCGHCGCMVCWTVVGEWPVQEQKMGVNCRMLSEIEIEGIERSISPGL